MCSHLFFKSFHRNKCTKSDGIYKINKYLTIFISYKERFFGFFLSTLSVEEKDRIRWVSSRISSVHSTRNVQNQEKKGLFAEMLTTVSRSTCLKTLCSRLKKDDVSCSKCRNRYYRSHQASSNTLWWCSLPTPAKKKKPNRTRLVFSKTHFTFFT